VSILFVNKLEIDMKVDVTLDNRARLNVALWAVWDADYKVKDKAHRVLDIVWVNPQTLEIYLDVATVRAHNCWDFLEEADNRGIFNAYSEQHTNTWAEKFANVQPWEIVPVRCIMRGYGTHDLSSKNEPCETLNMFFHWLEGQGRKPDEVYEELYQKCGVALLSPSEWAAAQEYDEEEYEDINWEDIELLDRVSEDHQMVSFLMDDLHYGAVIDQIEVDSYHMAVRLAMDLIVTSYDHYPQQDHTAYNHNNLNLFGASEPLV